MKKKSLEIPDLETQITNDNFLRGLSGDFQNLYVWQGEGEVRSWPPPNVWGKSLSLPKKKQEQLVGLQKLHPWPINM